MMAGRFLCFWDGLFSGAMLNFQGVKNSVDSCIYVYQYSLCMYITLPKSNRKSAPENSPDPQKENIVSQPFIVFADVGFREDILT